MKLFNTAILNSTIPTQRKGGPKKESESTKFVIMFRLCLRLVHLIAIVAAASAAAATAASDAAVAAAAAAAESVRNDSQSYSFCC